MYWNVPRTVPFSVIGFWCSVGASALNAGPDDLARPKSSSFAPFFVSITLPGLMSRWMIPRRCAASSADAISIPSFTT